MRAKPVIELSATAARAIVGATAIGLPQEVGGILLGYGQGSRTVVTDVLVLASAQPSFDRFVRDDVAANERLAEYRSRPNVDDAVGYVGEWHSHPSSVGPSAIDRAAILETARSGGREVALLVFAPWARQQFHGLTASPSKRWQALQAAKVVVEGEIVMTLDPLPAAAVRANGPVFISYRHNDGLGRAEELERLLHAGGITVWRDVRDLPPGNTEDRIDQAIAAGLSAAVLIVTPDIINSPVVRGREVPRLLELAEHKKFALVVASVVGRENNDRLNFDAPDVLLGLAPRRVLNAMNQLDVRTGKGRLEVVRGLLLHRIAQLKTDIASSARPFVITTQSRVDTRSIDGDAADLDIRLIPAESGKLPAAQGVQDLMSTLPLVSDAVRTSGAKSIQMSGGMHLSIAIALGAAFPETRFGQIEVVDLQGVAWSSVVSIRRLITQRQCRWPSLTAPAERHPRS
jgi:proteasome lid subunit RPN8/RPN11